MVSPLVLGALVLLATGASGVWAGRRGHGARLARRQRRALDTLGAISGRSVAAPLAPGDGSAPQAHVRVVAEGDAPPAVTPRPLTGGWRPTRATGAAPFRTPKPWRDPRVANGPSALPEVADPADIDEGSVRVLRPALPATPSPGASSAPPPGASQPAPLAAPPPGASQPALPTPVAPAPLTPVAPPAGAAPATLRFDDLDPADAVPPPPLLVDPAGATTRRAATRRSATRRVIPRRAAGRAVVVAGVVAILGGGAAGAWTLANPSRRHPPAAVPTAPSARPHTVSVPPRDVPTPRATEAVKLLSRTSGASVYRISGSATISLRASGPCWVEVRSGTESGNVVYEATMSAGSTKTVAGPVWVRLGNPPAMAVSVDGARVSPPVAAGTPYDLLFQTAQ